MFNKKGMTLVESLMSFSIFISVVILLVSFLNISLKQEIKVSDYYLQISKQEKSLSYITDFSKIIEMALH